VAAPAGSSCRLAAALVLILSLTAPGCYYAFDAIDLQYERERTDLPDVVGVDRTDRLRLELGFEGSGLRVQTQREVTCTDVRLERATVVTTEVYTLP
jgi:hypothetical protein